MTRLQEMEVIMKCTEGALIGLQNKIDKMNETLDQLNGIYNEFMEAVKEEARKKDEQKTRRQNKEKQHKV